ncbi:hypothetical protein SY83_05350 [Paenibacillus swuensis]|uniref:Regucalcin n=1 Tax=Paenibacillus swuensis TaxID=1178515 RepID=A0A172TFI9_9BACL|nr:SMP-30/gluconolactonase/LRE family protein [Paenibacillus swuensis]ANE45819.1 hypothetical protein SY83_05350 [Paenibacillus swuensis]
MVEYQADLLYNGRNELGEGPLWDERTGQIYWIDIKRHEIWSYHLEEGTARNYDVGQSIGSFGIREDGTFVCALRQGFFTMDPADGRLELIAELDSPQPEHRFNDGKCDPTGRFWAGTMPLQDSKPTGTLYRLREDGAIEPRRDGLVCSNGLCWSEDGATMYFIDSPTRVVSAFRFDPSSGNLSDERVVVRLPEGEGVPDGMTIDREGMLWVAQWDGWKVSRWDPQTGERLAVVHVPAARVTSCIFGSPEFDELFITTAGISQEDSERAAEQPLAGGLFRAKVNAQGRPIDRIR